MKKILIVVPAGYEVRRGEAVEDGRAIVNIEIRAENIRVIGEIEDA